MNTGNGMYWGVRVIAYGIITMIVCVMTASVSQADAGMEAPMKNPAQSGTEAGTVSNALTASSASAEEAAMASAAYLAGVGWEPSLAQRLSRQVEQELKEAPQPSRAAQIYNDLLKQRQASRERAESVAAQTSTEGVTAARDVSVADTVESAAAQTVPVRSMTTASVSWLLWSALAGLTALVAVSLGLLLRSMRRQRLAGEDDAVYAAGADADAFGDSQEDAFERGSLFEVSMGAPQTPVPVAERSRVHFLKRQVPSTVRPAPAPFTESPAHNPRRAAVAQGGMHPAGQAGHTGAGGMPPRSMPQGPNVVYVPVPVAAMQTTPAFRYGLHGA